MFWIQHNDQLPVGLLAQLVERCTSIAEVTSSNPIQAWIFARIASIICGLFDSIWPQKQKLGADYLGNENLISGLHGKFRWQVTHINFNPLHANTPVHILPTLLFTFPLALTRRICLTIKASEVGDHFLNSHDLNWWYSSSAGSRKQMLVILVV